MNLLLDHSKQQAVDTLSQTALNFPNIIYYDVSLVELPPSRTSRVPQCYVCVCYEVSGIAKLTTSEPHIQLPIWLWLRCKIFYSSITASRAENIIIDASSLSVRGVEKSWNISRNRRLLHTSYWWLDRFSRFLIFRHFCLLYCLKWLYYIIEWVNNGNRQCQLKLVY